MVLIDHPRPRTLNVPTRLLLACGVASSALWVIANDLVAASIYSGYSRVSQAISELSATYAPSRPVLVPSLVVYEGMMIAFGIGIWNVARNKRALKATSGLLIVGGAIGLVGLAFPLTQPPAAELVGGELPFSDTMHNVLQGGVGPLLMLVTYGFGAAALGGRFRTYSVLTAAAELAGGVLMLLFGTGVLGDAAEQWIGAAERLVAGAWMLWIAVLSIALLRQAASTTTLPVTKVLVTN